MATNAKTHSATTNIAARSAAIAATSTKPYNTGTPRHVGGKFMKVHISGKTPLERLTNFTKRIVAVPKEEVEREDQKWRKRREKRESSKR